MRKRRMKILTWAAAAVLLALCVALAMTGLNQGMFDVTFYRVSSDKIIGRLRIVQLSDLHLSQFGKDNAELVDAVAKLTPDIIAITGDMNISGNPDYRVVLTLCAQLTPIAPVYYSLGNHEYVDQIFSGSAIQKDLKALGVHVLDNQAESLTIGDNAIQIIGISESASQLAQTYGGDKTMAERFIEKWSGYEGFNLLLIHYPTAVPARLSAFDFDLALCGHEHGGLIRVPKLGGLYAPDEGLLPDYAEGYFAFRNNAMIVSRGLGNSSWVPRFNNDPELVVVDVTWN